MARRVRRIPVFMAALMVLAMGAAGSAAFRSAAPAVSVTSQRPVAVLHSVMTGPNEVNPPGDPNASGSTVVVLNAITGQVCYVIRVAGISSPLTAAHIHIGAAGVNGPVVIPFPLHGGPNVFAGCTTANKTLIQSIIDNPSGYYTNVHNAQFPAGVIRGQLMAFGPSAA